MWDRVMNFVEESPSVAISIAATGILFGIEIARAFLS